MHRALKYENLKIFTLDIHRSSGNHVSYDALESIKSGLIICDKYKGVNKSLFTCSKGSILYLYCCIDNIIRLIEMF